MKPLTYHMKAIGINIFLMTSTLVVKYYLDVIFTIYSHVNFIVHV